MSKNGEKNSKTDKKDAKNVRNLSEAQRDYILGMMKQKGVSETDIVSHFSVEPSIDEYIPMKVARAIIKYLEEIEDLPF